MKKTLALTLALVLALGLCAPALAAEEVAVATTQAVEVDGTPVTFETYALLDANGFQTNYAKLRDVACVLNGTAAQFAVDWSAQGGISVTTGQRYVKDGTEMSTPYSGDRAYQLLGEGTTVNGQSRAIAAIRLYDDNGNGYTYYKLRDLGAWLGFQVDWAEARGVFIDTGRVYSGADRDDVAALAGIWTGTLDLAPALAAAAADYPQFKDHLRFDAVTAPVTLTADALGQYTAALAEEDFNAALARAKTTFIDGMVDYAQEQFRDSMDLTLDQALTQSGVSLADFRGQFEKLFDDGMIQAAGQMLSQLNRTARWSEEQARTVRTGQNGLTLTLNDGTKIDFTRQ